MGSGGSGYVSLPSQFSYSSGEVVLWLCCCVLTCVLQIWEYFLAYSTIISRQGGATCYQITLVKNINSTHRVEGISTQFALQGALAKAQAGK